MAARFRDTIKKSFKEYTNGLSFPLRNRPCWKDLLGRTCSAGGKEYRE